MKTFVSLGVFFLLIVSLPACADKSALEQCVDDCGELPSYDASSSPCGADGWLYRNECQMACYGVEEAPDNWPCRSVPDPECTKEREGFARIDTDGCHLDFCASNDEGGFGWKVYAYDCGFPAPACFADCDACPRDEADWLCGADGVAYCNDCVMTCLEGVAATGGGTCHEPVVAGSACDGETETYAVRDDGCAVCECIRAQWHCPDAGCPGSLYGYAE